MENGGGTLILRGNGALLNTSYVEPRFGTTLQIDNTAVNNTDRIRDAASLNLRSGSFVYIGSPGDGVHARPCGT